jgi:hypothetical protein
MARLLAFGERFVKECGGRKSRRAALVNLFHLFPKSPSVKTWSYPSRSRFPLSLRNCSSTGKSFESCFQPQSLSIRCFAAVMASSSVLQRTMVSLRERMGRSGRVGLTQMCQPIVRRSTRIWYPRYVVSSFADKKLNLKRANANASLWFKKKAPAEADAPLRKQRTFSASLGRPNTTVDTYAGGTTLTVDIQTRSRAQ